MENRFKGKLNSTLTAIIIMSFAILLLIGLSMMNFFSIHSLGQERQEQEALLEDSRLNLAYLDGLKDKSGQLQQELEEAEALLPLNMQQGDLIQRFQALGEKYPGQMGNLVFEEAQLESGNQILPFKAVYKGEYGDLITILYDISTWSRLVSLDEITLKGEASQEGTISATILGKAFFR